VDAAVAEQDPLMRIAYVAAFAMSNYSSTIGRIAKPFNPMLVRLFRYAHHALKNLMPYSREKRLNMSDWREDTHMSPNKSAIILRYPLAGRTPQAGTIMEK
jgi:hypothetical protein